MQSKGEYRVGTNFNPSEKSIVDEIKQKSAELIDLIEEGIKMQPANSSLDGIREGEVMRLKSLAQTNIEQGAMWAVKAATKGDPK